VSARRLTLELQRRVHAWSPKRADLTRWASAALGARAAGAPTDKNFFSKSESERVGGSFEIGERESPPVYPLQFECEPNNGGIVYLSRGRKRRFA